MKKSRHYEYQTIDPKTEAMDDWYEEERRNISESERNQSGEGLKGEENSHDEFNAAFMPIDVQDAAYRIIQKDEKMVETYLFLQKIDRRKPRAERLEELMEFFKPDGRFLPDLIIKQMDAPGSTPEEGAGGAKPHKELWLAEFMMDSAGDFPDAVMTYMHEMSHYIDIWYASLAPLFHGTKMNRRDERKRGVVDEKKTNIFGKSHPDALSGISVKEQQSALKEYLVATNKEIVDVMTKEINNDTDTKREKLVKVNYQAEVARVGHKLEGKEYDDFYQTQLDLLNKGEDLAFDGVVIESAYKSYDAWTVKDKKTKQRDFGKLELGNVFEKQLYANHHEGKTEEWAESYKQWFRDTYKDELVLQRKSISPEPENDSQETEADAIANEVVNGGGKKITVRNYGAPVRPHPKDAETSPQFQSLLVDSMYGGQAIDDETRMKLESKFQTDFSTVKIHTDTNAAHLSEMISAQAFTIGSHIFFGDGYYQPGTPAGDLLIAHELVHVVQQRQSGARIQRQVTDLSTDVNNEIVLKMVVPFKSTLIGSGDAEFVLDVKKGPKDPPTFGNHVFGPAVDTELTTAMDAKGNSNVIGDAISSLFSLKWDTQLDPKKQSPQEQQGPNYYWSADFVPFQFSTAKGWGLSEVTIAFHGLARNQQELDSLGLTGQIYTDLINAGYTIDVSLGATYELSWSTAANTASIIKSRYTTWRTKVRTRQIDEVRNTIDDLEQSKTKTNQKIDAKKAEVKQSELDDMAKEKKGKNYDELKGKDKRQVKKDLYEDKKANPEKYSDDASAELKRERERIERELAEQEERLSELKRLRRSGKSTWIKRSSRWISQKVKDTQDWIKLRQRWLSRKVGQKVEQKLTKFAEEKIAKWFGRKLGPKLARLFTKYVAKVLAKVIAKAILHAIPIIGWIMFAWDVLELLWEFRHEIWNGIKKLWDYILHPEKLWQDMVKAIKDWWKDALRQKFGIRDWRGKPGDDQESGTGGEIDDKNVPGGEGSTTGTAQQGDGKDPNAQGSGTPGTDPQGDSETDQQTDNVNGTDPNGTATDETNIPGNVPGDVTTGNANDANVSNGTDPNTPAPNGTTISAGGTDQNQTTASGTEQTGTTTDATTDGQSTDPNVTTQNGTGTTTTLTPGTSESDPNAAQGTDPNAVQPKANSTVGNTTNQTGEGQGLPGTEATSGQQMEGAPNGKEGTKSTTPAQTEIPEVGKVIPYTPPITDEKLNLHHHGARGLSAPPYKVDDPYSFKLIIHYFDAAGVKRMSISSQAERFIYKGKYADAGWYLFKVDVPFSIEHTGGTVYYAKGFGVKVCLE